MRIFLIAISIVVIGLTTILCTMRWRAHAAHVAQAERRSAEGARIVGTYTRDLEQMHATGNAWSARFKAMFGALDHSGSNVFGQLGIARRYADDLRDDTTFDRLMARLSSDIPNDASFDKEARVMKDQERAVRDALTAFSTTIGVFLTNPLLASGIAEDDGRNLGRRLGSGAAGMGKSWTALETIVSHRRDNARVTLNAARTELRNTKNASFISAVMQP
jgi:hypothetical protein